ncbi:MAG: hypothetical protein QGH20_10565 [Candidatus Latescibacteria bacterium]|nr:hypothetical protein [Candidatus Latescibacterota bacterium]
MQHKEQHPRNFPEKYGNDFAGVGISPSPDDRPRSGVDEWSAVWDDIGEMALGEVKDFPLKRWEDFDRLNIPNHMDPKRWRNLEGARERAGDRFLFANGISIYERVHFIRSLENTWTDIYEAPERLCELIELLSLRFASRIAFHCPVDIQQTMVYGSFDQIREYCRELVGLAGLWIKRVDLHRI